MLINQNPAAAEAVADAIRSSITTNVIAYRVAVAYVTAEGARKLLRILNEELGPNLGGVAKTIVTCFDFGHTEPAGLEQLQAAGFEVRISNLGLNQTVQLRPRATSFHPKVYLACESDRALAIIGSANLSRRALSVNSETVFSAELTINEAAEFWDGVAATSVMLTPELLESYRAIRPSQRASPVADEPVIPPIPSADTLGTLRESVSCGTVQPANFTAFWVVAGDPGGGSDNQLELPRYANRFFGFVFDDYDSRLHLPIGDVTLTSASGSWTRQLAWHGDNRMERIYLPTAPMSGEKYGNRVVLFTRADGYFKFVVADIDSSQATDWLQESASMGTLYRLGERTSRLCGLI